MKVNPSCVVSIIALASALIAANPVSAQDNEGANGRETVTQLEEILVTARRKTESASTTPVTVNVFSRETLSDANITNETDLRTISPGVTVRATVSSNQLNYTIRGQSKDAFSDTRPGVMPYVNEVQVGGAGAATAFYDLESIQILKGPQGTLFGRSATGGAVLFQTARAQTDEFGGYGSVLYGNLDAVKAEGALNLPVVEDTFALRIAGFYSERDGFQRNLLDFTAPGGFFNGFVPFSMGAAGPYMGPGGPDYSGQDLPNQSYGDYERSGARGTLALVLDTFTNDLVYDYYRADGRSVQPVLRAFNPQALVPIQFIPDFAPLLDAALAAQTARDPFTVNTDGNSAYETENVVITNTTAIDLGWATIKNIFGYTDIKTDSANEVDGTIMPLSSNFPVDYSERIRERTDQVSNEIQIAGEFGALDLVAGGYYQSEENTTLAFPTLFFVTSYNLGSFALENETYAGYAQGTYQLGDSGFSLTAGLRYTDEEVSKAVLPDDDLRTTFGDTPPPGVSYFKADKYNHWSWTLGVDYQASDEHMLYLTSRRAFKSGGFNGVLTPVEAGDASVGGDAYDQARITDVEAGWKFNGALGDRPMRAEFASYYNWIKNDQRVIYSNAPGPTALTTNVPEATVFGVELALELELFPGFSVGGMGVYTDAEFEDEPVFVFGSGDVIYDQVPDTPEITGSFFADYVAPLSGDLELLLHGDVYYQDDAFIAPISVENNGGAGVISSYTVANFRLGIRNEANGWSVIANVKNAFDETYFVGGMPVGALYATSMLIPGEPRTYTLELRKAF